MEKTNFKDLGLSDDVLKAIADMGITTPSAIQEKAIPIAMDHKDCIGQAQTGTGKTLAFGSVLLTGLEGKHKNIEALILSPTRELALQIQDELNALGKYSKAKTTCVYGGSAIDKQIKSIRKGVDIVVGTPGRVMDLMRRKVIKLDSLKYMVLDEADEMLNMGFIDEIESILKETPEDKQTLLFSATMPSNIKKIASFYMKDDYQHIAIKAKQQTATSVLQYYFESKSHNKFEVLCRILDSRDMSNAIIFCKTKRSVDEITAKMQQKHYSAEAMHGDLTQVQRMKTLKRFKQGTVQYLVATDVAARGIDVENISHVINYEMPQEQELYIHRIGRTGRAQRKGEAYSIVTAKEKLFLERIARTTHSKISPLEVPSSDDVFDKKIKELLFDVQEEMLKEVNPTFKDVVKDIPGNMKDDVIATLLAMSYKQRVGFDYGDIDDTQDKYDRIFMTCGSMDKVKAEDIVRFMIEHAKIKRKDIGHIDVKRKFTFVDVKSECSKNVIEKCQNKKIKNRKVKLEYSQKG